MISQPPRTYLVNPLIPLYELNDNPLGVRGRANSRVQGPLSNRRELVAG
jgi:hypothetical protein